MAIKLMGVDEGDRVLASDAPGTRTHDIVLTNHHHVLPEGREDLRRLHGERDEQGEPALDGRIFSSPIRSTASAPSQFVSQTDLEPITSNYYSATPYKLGSQVVKYKAKPCDGAESFGRARRRP
jgi:hypothetical protein